MSEPSPAPTEASSGSSRDAARAKCRHCGARLRQDAAWCPLCHAAVTDDPAPEPAPAAPAAPPVPAARTGEPQDDAPAPEEPVGRRSPRAEGETRSRAKARAQSRARARAKGLIAAPVLPRAKGDGRAQDDAPSRPELTEERIDELLSKLAESETPPDVARMFGPLRVLHGRAGGLALPVVLALGVLVVGLVVMGIVGIIF